MKLMLKNKVLMSIAAIVAEGIKRGGIPRELHFEPAEATDFLQEYSYLKKEEKKEEFKQTPTKSVLIKKVDDYQSQVDFHLNGHLDPEKVKEIIKEWYLGHIEIFYIHRDHGAITYIPLKVKTTKKKSPPKLEVQQSQTISGQLPPPKKKKDEKKDWG